MERKPKLISVTCQECQGTIKEEKRWYGQSEICKSCAIERNMKDNCKRHLGRDGLDCYLCHLENVFSR